MINSDKIKGRMRELRLTQVDVANAIGVKPCTINQKLNNARPLNLTEAEKLCEMLHIPTGEFGTYFFAN